MPTGIYERTPEQVKVLLMFGAIANRQRQTIAKTKVELVRAGSSVVCKKHGAHKDWRIHSGNNVQCKKCASEAQHKYRNQHPLRFLLRWARKRNLPIDITEDFLVSLLEKQQGRCALTGLPFTEIARPSLDRIDSNKGYLKSNVQLVLHEINRMKTDLPQERFLELCGLVCKHKI